MHQKINEAINLESATEFDISTLFAFTFVYLLF